MPDDDLNEQKHVVHSCKYIKVLCQLHAWSVFQHNKDSGMNHNKICRLGYSSHVDHCSVDCCYDAV